MNSPAIEIEKILLLTGNGNEVKEVLKKKFSNNLVIQNWNQIQGEFNTFAKAETLVIIDLSELSSTPDAVKSAIQTIATNAVLVISYYDGKALDAQTSSILKNFDLGSNTALGQAELLRQIASFDIEAEEHWNLPPYPSPEDFTLGGRANFKFKTLEDARVLCDLISSQCPDPPLTSIGLLELMINAIEHGNLEISYEEKSALLKEGNWQNEIKKRLTFAQYKDRLALLTFVREPNRIEIIITDEGAGFNAEKYLNPKKSKLDDKNGDQYHGRGIAVANQLDFEKIEYLGVGNQVRICILTN